MKVIIPAAGAGKRLNDGRVVPNFIGQALRGEDLLCTGMACRHGVSVT